MALLEVYGLEKSYKRRKVVDGVDFDVESGEVVGLLGPNGAGKTTSFRMTIGLIDADKGRVVFDGQDMSRLRPGVRCASEICSTRSGPVPGGRTGISNLRSANQFRSTTTA